MDHDYICPKCKKVGLKQDRRDMCIACFPDWQRARMKRYAEDKRKRLGRPSKPALQPNVKDYSLAIACLRVSLFNFRIPGQQKCIECGDPAERAGRCNKHG